MKKQGFTLVEVVVTLMIIITLSLLSFPIYKGRSHKTSVLAEGYALLGAIVDAQITYFNEYGNFLSSYDTSSPGRADLSYYCTENVLGISAINNRYFTSFSVFHGNYYTEAVNRSNAAYHFVAVARSKEYGSVSIEYNVTKRSEPVVSGV